MEAVSQFVIIAISAPLAYVGAIRFSRAFGWTGWSLLAVFGAVFGGISAGVGAVWPFVGDAETASNGALAVARLLGAAVVGILVFDLLGKIDLSSVLQQGAARVDAGRQAYSAAAQVATPSPAQPRLAQYESEASAQEVGVFPAVVDEHSAYSSSTASATAATAQAIQAPTLRSASPALPGLAIAVLACAILVMIGSFGAWVTVSGFGGSGSGSGTDDLLGLNGRWTALLGAAALLLTLGRFVMGQPGVFRLLSFGAAGSFTAVAFLGVYDVIDILRGGDAFFGFVDVSIGWGLIMVVAAAVVGAIVALMLAIREGTTPR